MQITTNALLLADYQEDLDGDGIDDGWATQHFGHSPLTPEELAGDPDGDGLANREEAIAGTDPQSSASLLRFLPLPEPTAVPTVRFAYVPGKFYRLWFSEDLSTWTEVAPLTLSQPEPGVAEWVDLGGGSAEAGYYRIAVE